MMSPGRKLRVFLCHSSDDKPIVRELYHQLDLEGWIDVWLDEKSSIRAKTGIMRLNKP